MQYSTEQTAQKTIPQRQYAVHCVYTVLFSCHRGFTSSSQVYQSHRSSHWLPWFPMSPAAYFLNNLPHKHLVKSVCCSVVQYHDMKIPICFPATFSDLCFDLMLLGFAEWYWFWTLTWFIGCVWNLKNAAFPSSIQREGRHHGTCVALCLQKCLHLYFGVFEEA